MHSSLVAVARALRERAAACAWPSIGLTSVAGSGSIRRLIACSVASATRTHFAKIPSACTPSAPPPMGRAARHVLLARDEIHAIPVLPDTYRAGSRAQLITPAAGRWRARQCRRSFVGASRRTLPMGAVTAPGGFVWSGLSSCLSRVVALAVRMSVALGISRVPYLGVPGARGLLGRRSASAMSFPASPPWPRTLRSSSQHALPLVVAWCSLLGRYRAGEKAKTARVPSTQNAPAR